MVDVKSQHFLKSRICISQVGHSESRDSFSVVLAVTSDLACHLTKKQNAIHSIQGIGESTHNQVDWRWSKNA